MYSVVGFHDRQTDESGCRSRLSPRLLAASVLLVVMVRNERDKFVFTQYNSSSVGDRIAMCKY